MATQADVHAGRLFSLEAEVRRLASQVADIASGVFADEGPAPEGLRDPTYVECRKSERFLDGDEVRGQCDGVAAEGLSALNFDLGPGRYFIGVRNKGDCSISILFNGVGRLPAAAPRGGFGGGEVMLPNSQVLILRCEKAENCPDCIADVTIIKLA